MSDILLNAEEKMMGVIDNRCGCYSVFYHQIEAGIFKKITEGSI